MDIYASLIDVLYRIAILFEMIGSAVIIFGAGHSIWHYFSCVIAGNKQGSLDLIRLELGRSIILGLEFFVGGDIIRTVIMPDYYEIGLLAILVLIRTVLSYFLTRELASLGKKLGDKIVIKSGQ